MHSSKDQYQVQFCLLRNQYCNIHTYLLQWYTALNNETKTLVLTIHYTLSRVRRFEICCRLTAARNQYHVRTAA
jgi:hypothetical protein